MIPRMATDAVAIGADHAGAELVEDLERRLVAAGTVMKRTRTPLSIWFWAAYLVSSHTPGMSAVQFQRQLGLNRAGAVAWRVYTKLREGAPRVASELLSHPDRRVEDCVHLRVSGKGRGRDDELDIRDRMAFVGKLGATDGRVPAAEIYTVPAKRGILRV
jgi:hypothetical protein